MKNTFKLSETTLAVFGTFLDEIVSSRIVIMTAFGNFCFAKHLFQFLEVGIFPCVGCANKASLSLT